MLIDHIELFNFRAYQGVQRLSLSVNPEKHVTIVSGRNGFGKTSLLTALVWILYGKLMADVDERFRKEIYESGGYHKYAFKFMNRNALQEAGNKAEDQWQLAGKTTNVLEKRNIKARIDELYSFSGSIRLTNIFIPHLACNNVLITRTYNTSNDQESLEILIDGKQNELTKTIGQDIFINDFILPKEIAKFFFFDAEKITALAEVKSLDEKLYFSKAYNEVLGIKKFTDLKQNLDNLHLRISKKSASKSDLKKIDALQLKLREAEELLAIHSDELERREHEWVIKKADLAEIQERLVRVGSAMSSGELSDSRQAKAELQDAMVRNKANFTELLELAPFAMLAGKMKTVQQQIASEERQQHYALINDLLQEKYQALKQEFLKLGNNDQSEIDRILQSHLAMHKNAESPVLLNFTEEQVIQFNMVYSNLQNAYLRSFKELVADRKRLQSSYNMVYKKLQDADMKASDPVIQKLKSRFSELTKEVEILADKMINARIEIGILGREIAVINKQLSEQNKYIKVERQDQQKVETTARLSGQLDTFIHQLKLKKKSGLEKNVKKELNSLMHKENFVDYVEVKIEGDLIDVELYDAGGNLISKEGLSKGEQQLYATALLKALVTESSIQFPVFVDSPLQKLDKTHSINIIREFYPSVSSQVVLFPLLEKELSEEEYEVLLPKVGKAYLILQAENYASSFLDLKPADLFEELHLMQ